MKVQAMLRFSHHADATEFISDQLCNRSPKFMYTIIICSRDV